MTLIIILSILVLAAAWLLLAPLYLYISTSESRYEAGLTGIFKIGVTAGEDGLPQLMGKIFFIGFKVPLFKFKERKVKAATKKKRKKKVRKLTRKRIKLILKIIWKIIRSFKLKQLKLNLDTGDVIRNAYLIPVFSFAYRENIRFTVNYEDKNEFLIHFENTLGRIIIQTISTFFKHHLKK